MTLRDASSRATKAFYPALSMCDLIFSGIFERHPRLTLAIVEFELGVGTPPYRERHGEAIYRFKDGMLLPSSTGCSETAPPKRLSSAGRPAAPGTRATPATIWRARGRWRNGRDRCRARNSAPRPRPRSRP